MGAALVGALLFKGPAQGDAHALHNPVAWVSVKVSSGSRCAALEERPNSLDLTPSSVKWAWNRP